MHDGENAGLGEVGLFGGFEIREQATDIGCGRSCRWRYEEEDLS